MKTLATDRTLVTSWLLALAGQPLPAAGPGKLATQPAAIPAPAPKH